MPKVLPEYLELRRQQILDAAAGCFARKGFHQTTMQDICHDADLSPGAVYRYFRSKEEIIQAMCARGHSQDVETIRTTMAKGDTWEVFDELVRVFFGEAENRELCAISVELISEARRNDFIRDSIRAGWAGIRTQLAEIVRQAQERGEIDPGLDPRAAASVMMGIYQGLLQQTLIEPEADIAAYAQVVRSLFHGCFWQAGAVPRPQRRESPAALRH